MGNRSKVLEEKSSQRVKKQVTIRITYIGAAIALMLICIIPYISNATIGHTSKVDFEGDIYKFSDFLVREHFRNNSWISAWEVRKYEESPTMKVDGLNLVVRPLNYIDVDESAAMASSINESSYAFNYNAMIKNGVIETKDATGWTNRTRIKKYDWENEARTSGNEINITNVLYDSEELITASGPEGEWLPCCYKVAPVSSIKSGNQHNEKKNLKVGMVTSFQDMQLTASVNGTTNLNNVEPPVMESQSYCGDSCDGYDCICKYDDTVGVTPTIIRTTLQRCGCRKLDIKAYIFDINSSDTYLFNNSVNELAKHVRCSITVSNSCDDPLNDITVIADMPIGMIYAGSYYGDCFDRNTSYLKAFDINTEKKFIWNIGDLSSGEKKTILIDTFLKRDLENFNVSVKVFDINASGARIIGLNPRICTYHAFEPSEA